MSSPLDNIRERIEAGEGPEQDAKGQQIDRDEAVRNQ
jgi:hypothetical protein